MTWQAKTKAVLDKYYQDDGAKMVCIACFNRFKAVEYAVAGKGDAAEAVMAVMVNDYIFLPANGFWQVHGNAIANETSSRFFEWLKANQLLDENRRNQANMHQAIMADVMGKSFIGIADLILRLHIPFDQYTAASLQLHNDLAAIEEL